MIMTGEMTCKDDIVTYSKVIQMQRLCRVSEESHEKFNQHNQSASGN